METRAKNTEENQETVKTKKTFVAYVSEVLRVANNNTCVKLQIAENMRSEVWIPNDSPLLKGK